MLSIKAAGIGKSLKTEKAVRLANAAVIRTPERQIIIEKMNGVVVDLKNGSSSVRPETAADDWLGREWTEWQAANDPPGSQICKGDENE